MPNPEPRPGPPPNHLLTALPPREYRPLARSLPVVSLNQGQALYEPDELIRHVYFPEAGLVSIIAPLEDGAQIEVGMIGREGMVGLPLLLGIKANPFRAVV